MVKFTDWWPKLRYFGVYRQKPCLTTTIVSGLVWHTQVKGDNSQSIPLFLLTLCQLSMCKWSSWKEKWKSEWLNYTLRSFLIMMDKVLPFLLHKSGVWTPFQSAQCYQSTQQFINAIRVRTAVDQFRHLPSSWLSNSLSTVATAEMQGEKAKKWLI